MALSAVPNIYYWAYPSNIIHTLLYTAVADNIECYCTSKKLAL